MKPSLRRILLWFLVPVVLSAIGYPLGVRWVAKGHYRRAEALHSSGHLEEALAAFTRVIELRPDNAEAWHSLGVIHLQQDRFAEAASALREAVTRFEPAWAAFNTSAAIRM